MVGFQSPDAMGRRTEKRSLERGTDVVETGRCSCFARADPVAGKRRRIAAVSHRGKEGETCRSRRGMNEFSNGCEW